MIIFSFDCAIKNLGFCCVEINEKWREKASACVDKINDFYKSIPNDPNKIIENIYSLVKTLHAIINNMFKLIYFNRFNLICEKKVKEEPYDVILSRLKFVMKSIDITLLQPNIVLIENQWKINDLSRGISRFIQDHYSCIDFDNVDYRYLIPTMPLEEINEEKMSTIVHIVPPTFKNAFKTDPTEAGDYSSFISKYSNYLANKKHTTHNFLYYLKKSGQESHVNDIAEAELDDIADAFMMAYSWCRVEKII